jgi:hypothetical protein
MTPIKFCISEILNSWLYSWRYVAIGFIVIFSNPGLVLNSGK